MPGISTAALALALVASSAFAPAAQAFCPPAGCITVGPTTSFNGNQFTLNGEYLLISGGQIVGTQLSATNATLRSGLIDYTFGAGGTFDFFGTTRLPGGAPGSTLDVLYDQFDSGGIDLVNHGTFIQSGTGAFNIFFATFVNPLFGTYEIQNDLGFGEAAPGIGTFVNQSATLWKTQGTGTSVIAARIEQQNGKVEAWTGQILFSGGGSHDNSRFFADTFGTNAQAIGIAFAGTHVFTGTTLTETGGLSLNTGGTLNVSGTWNQNAAFTSQGAINLAPAATLNNQGAFTIGSGAVLAGSGTLRNAPGAQFDVSGGNIAPDTQTGVGITVVNEGNFTIAAGRTANVAGFTNNAGILRVNGELTNQNGTLQVLGGELWGSGIINGDVFVGGGPGVASFNPGNSPGTMTIRGAFSLLQGGVLNLEVERDAFGALMFDRVIADSVMLDGQVNLVVGAGVAESDVAGLTFFSCGGASTCDIAYGANFSLTQPDGWSLTNLTPGIAPVPEPFGAPMLLSGLALIALLAQRRRREAGIAAATAP
jgi:hypothetical protein